MSRRCLLALVLVAACGDGGASSGGRPDAGFAIESCQGGGGFNLQGTFGVLTALNVHINAMGLVDTEAAAELLLLIDVTQNGADVAVVSARPCALKVPEVPVAGQDKPVTFTVSQKLIDSVRPIEDKKATVSALTTCATFETEPITLLIGARMSPPSSGNLPEADSSGAFSICQPSQADCYDAITVMCACDQEQDGKPGATLGAANVPGISLDEVYVDLRATVTLSGQVWSSDRIQGEVVAALQQGILGCHLATGGACTPAQVGAVKNLNPIITPQPGTPSTFRAVRVPAGTRCADVVAMRDTLFPR